MAIIPVTLGETARLALVLENGDAAQFPQAKVYQPTVASPIATLNLSHTAEGLYESSYVPLAVGVLNIVYTVFSDAPRTVLNTNFSKELDQILTQAASNIPSLINDLIDKIIRLLGLTHENAVIDNTTYDDCCQMTASRLRIFDSAANASAATDGGSETVGLIATYLVTAEYEGPSKMKLYRMVKV